MDVMQEPIRFQTEFLALLAGPLPDGPGWEVFSEGTDGYGDVELVIRNMNPSQDRIF